ncbi:preprotein translocase subunit SecE [Candidatus Nardonella dryophthoridicola]|uniref:preprotein translocase subunit SecE n=1 Tax=Candidatus Nardonella dryophthoridicola TaxID=1971485 RepID=UPI003B973839
MFFIYIKNIFNEIKNINYPSIKKNFYFTFIIINIILFISIIIYYIDKFLINNIFNIL